MERDGKRWKEVERDGKRWKEVERGGKRWKERREERKEASSIPGTKLGILISGVKEGEGELGNCFLTRATAVKYLSHTSISGLKTYY
jgi:hypothetical protein